jgi:L-amino acid N-acyltransferase YncA
MLRPVEPEDAGRIAAIYNYYVAETTITFDELPVQVAEFEARIRRHTKTHPWLVAESDGEIVGYACATPWHERTAYRKSAETVVYLAKGHIGQGIGSKLYAALLQELKQQELHSALAVIALPNPESIGLVEKFGFSKVGDLKEIGRKFGQWVDVGIWQLLLCGEYPHHHDL